MVMGERIHFFQWYERLKDIDANVFFIYASFDEELPSKGGISEGNYTCMRNDTALRCQTIFIPNTTWTEGRNLLAEEAVREEKRSGKLFTYWAFADDDISCHISNHEMANKIYRDTDATWEDLKCWQHVFDYMGSSIVPERASNIAMPYRTHASSFQAASNIDACFVAFKRDDVPFFLPYPALRPGFSWWMSQAALFCVINTSFRQSTALVPYIYANINMGPTKPN